MKAYPYVRVSGLSQVDGDGPVRQLEAVTTFCLANQLSVAEAAFEKGVSGTVDGMDRPVFSELLGKINPAEECIVVERLDRLARDLMVQELLLRECRARGVRVYTADQGVLVDVASDGGDPTRKLIRQLMGAIAEWEKSVLVKKLYAGRQRTNRWGGEKPYGATTAEQHMLAAIKGIRQCGHSYTATANLLNMQGLAPRGGGTWDKWKVLNALRGPRSARKSVAK